MAFGAHADDDEHLGMLRILTTAPAAGIRPIRRAGVVLPLCAALIAGTAIGWRWQQAQGVASTESAAAGLARDLRALQATGSASAPAGDYARRLPPSAPVEPVVDRLQRAGAAAGVTFGSFSATARPASEQALGRTELAVTLRGSYANLKPVLADVLQRFPALVLQHLTLRRGATGGDLEARIDVVLPTRPLVAQPAASAASQ